MDTIIKVSKTIILGSIAALIVLSVVLSILSAVFGVG